MSTTTNTSPILTTVVAITTLARGAHLRSTTGLDLRTKIGGTLHVRIGRGGTTVLTSAILLYIEPVHPSGARVHPVQLYPTPTTTAAAIATTCAASGNNAGSTALTVASTASMAAGDMICIQDNASPTVATEWHRVSKVTSGTVLELCNALEVPHNNTGHTVRTFADVFSFPLPGGQQYALVLDYGPQTTGEAVTVEAMIETVDSLTTA